MSLKPLLYTPPELSAENRVHGRNVLYLNGFLMLFGYFTIISVTALHFTHDIRLTATAVGVALAARQFTQQGLDLFGGVFGERFGYRISITLGCFIRALGFIGFSIARTFPELMFAALIAGFGGMFFDATGSGAMAAVVKPEERSRIFSISATINNVGAALGPLVGVFAYAYWGYQPVGLLAALVFVIIGLETYFFLPDHIERFAASQKVPAPSLGRSLRAALSNREYIITIAALMGFWSILSQISLTVPLIANKIGGASGVAIILGINAFLAIPLQYPLVRLAERYMSLMKILGISALICVAGMVIVYFATNMPMEITGIVLATIGSLAVSPITAAISAKVAPPRALAVFYGISAIGIGAGGALGMFIGGRLYDLQQALHSQWFLGVFTAIVGVTVAWAFLQTKTPGVCSLPASRKNLATMMKDQSGVVHP